MHVCIGKAGVCVLGEAEGRTCIREVEGMCIWKAEVSVLGRPKGCVFEVDVGVWEVEGLCI